MKGGKRSSFKHYYHKPFNGLRVRMGEWPLLRLWSPPALLAASAHSSWLLARHGGRQPSWCLMLLIIPPLPCS